jgi:hypothetical protein
MTSLENNPPLGSGGYLGCAFLTVDALLWRHPKPNQLL